MQIVRKRKFLKLYHDLFCEGNDIKSLVFPYDCQQKLFSVKMCASSSLPFLLKNLD